MPRPIPASCSLQTEATTTVRKSVDAEKAKKIEVSLPLLLNPIGSPGKIDSTSKFWPLYLIQCPQCGKKFSKTSNLNRHMISHNGGKPFKCQVCNAKFKRSDYLADHCRREHEKLVNKICKKCNEGFATRTQLFHHKCKN